MCNKTRLKTWHDKDLFSPINKFPRMYIHIHRDLVCMHSNLCTSWNSIFHCTYYTLHHKCHLQFKSTRQMQRACVHCFTIYFNFIFLKKKKEKNETLALLLSWLNVCIYSRTMFGTVTFNVLAQICVSSYRPFASLCCLIFFFEFCCNFIFFLCSLVCFLYIYFLQKQCREEEKNGKGQIARVGF